MRKMSMVCMIGCAAAGLSLAQQQSHPGGRATGKAEAGAQVFQSHCAVCHSILPGATLVGPSLAGEMKGPTAASVRTIVLNGKGKMRGLKGQLTEPEMSNLMAYLKTL